MAGTVHEVENHALLAEVEREAANAAQELVEAARLHRGQIVVIGCSTSEVVGHQVGSWSTPEAAQAIFRGLQSVFAPRGVYLAAQCCEHLNRALIVEHEAVPNAEIVNVLPQPKAGSSFATAAYESFRHPVALEEIRADAGLDIGGTLRLGSYPCRLDPDSRAYELYGEPLIHERHRHRYEVNNDYRTALTDAGMRLCGMSPDGRIVEMLELPDHPYFLATQAHPEFNSRPNHPHPLFLGLISSAVLYRSEEL